ncbi:timeless-domain-containing protein [Anopheles sinensis]|uniref:Timeless-domain-containing protein n=1 Tax=Anopheles sinensis TaxID=74873 RepID=A0A084WRZ6_ANOSI|nr:timeless-domain-containing protein [Anopheles sinensis]
MTQSNPVRLVGPRVLLSLWNTNPPQNDNLTGLLVLLLPNAGDTNETDGQRIEPTQGCTERRKSFAWNCPFLLHHWNKTSPLQQEVDLVDNARGHFEDVEKKKLYRSVARVLGPSAKRITGLSVLITGSVRYVVALPAGKTLFPTKNQSGGTVAKKTGPVGAGGWRRIWGTSFG